MQHRPVRCIVAALIAITVSAVGCRYSAPATDLVFGRAGAASAPTATIAPSATATVIARPTATFTPVPSPTTAPELVVRLDDAALSEPVQSALVGRPLVETVFGAASVRYVTVHVLDDHLMVTGDAQAGPLILPVSMTGTVVLEDGHPTVRIHSATVAGARLPDEVHRDIERVLQAEVDAAVAREGLDVRAVRMESGVLTVRGRRR